MVKQIILPILAVMVFIAAVGFYFQGGIKINLPVSNTPGPSAPPTRTVMISDKIIKVEVANSSELRSRGLSGRSSLEANAGMVFVFEDQDVMPGFWMKDMLIPLDFIWVNDGKIVRIDTNIQPPAKGTSDSKLRVYYPGQPIDYILEVNGGFSGTNNIRVGDAIDLSGAI